MKKNREREIETEKVSREGAAENEKINSILISKDGSEANEQS